VESLFHNVAPVPGRNKAAMAAGLHDGQRVCGKIGMQVRCQGKFLEMQLTEIWRKTWAASIADSCSRKAGRARLAPLRAQVNSFSHGDFHSVE
jgi:hypothetical protein